jgi:hypothetical protein
MTGSYSVPGDFFDNLADPRDSEPETFAVFDYDDEELYGDYADYRPGHRHEQVELNPLDVAIKELRKLSGDLRRDRHPLAHVPQQIANRLVDVHAPAPQIIKSQYEPSPTGNCKRCQRPLDMPTMKRGRPRQMCTICSPPKRAA